MCLTPFFGPVEEKAEVVANCDRLMAPDPPKPRRIGFRA